jgi:hypothetical protein
MITVKHSNNDSIHLTERIHIERAILQNNKAKFSQSFHTPFYQPPLKEEFSVQGTMNAAQAVLAGVYKSNTNLDPLYMKHWNNLRCQIQLGR